MSTDIERELRDLFHEKAGQAPRTVPTPAAAPKQVLRRSRLHQVGTVVGSSVLVVVLIVGSVAGLTRILGEGNKDAVGIGDYEVFHRTATIEAFTVGSPSDWYLVNTWPATMQTPNSVTVSTEICSVDPEGVEVCEQDAEAMEQLDASPHGLPMFQLSNVDMGLDSLACREGLADDAAVLHVALQEGPMPDLPDSTIQPFPPGIGLPPEGDGPCGPGRYARFTLNGRIFFAWIGIGASVSEEDREVVETAYEMMSAHDDWEPAQPDHETPAYVIAGGFDDADGAWRLELRPSQANVELTLMGVTPWGALPGFSVPDPPIEWCCGDELTDPVFGAITKEANGVEFRPGTENTYFDVAWSPVRGTIVPVPPSLGDFGFDVFFIDPPAGGETLGGHVLALGLDGSASVTPPPVAQPRTRTVELSGSFEGQEWHARFWGAFTGPGSPCWEVTVDGPPGHVCPDPVHSTLAGPSPYLVGSNRPDLYLLAGSVPPEVTEIRFDGDDDAIVPQQFRCAMGPVGWTDPDRKVCAIALPPAGSGTLEYLDADGAVVFEEGIGWGVAEPESDQYPWTNENTFITATGSFQGAEWKLQVLYYEDGYRLTIDGRIVFEGRPFGLAEARAFPLFEGDRAGRDALVFVLTPDDVRSVSIVTAERTWESRWIPGSTVSGGEGRLWVFEMPGSGTGSYWLNGNSLQGEVSWP